MSKQSSRWPTVRLKYLASVNDETLTDATPPEHELAYLDIGSVGSDGSVGEPEVITFDKAPSRARRIARDGDVIISTVRTYLTAIAPIEEAPDNLIVSTGFAVVRPDPEKLEPHFCKYALRDPHFIDEVKRLSVGVNYPAINVSDLVGIEIPRPPLPEQWDIAARLDRETARLDAQAREYRQLIDGLVEKRLALVAHAVTRGLDPDAPTKHSGVEWLGEVPAHWDVRRLATLFREIDNRGRPDLPLLNVSINTGVTEREFSDDRIEYVSADLGTQKVAREGDIVFNKMRMWQGAVGLSPTEGLVSPDYVVARPTEKVCRPYLEALFRSPIMSAEFARHSNGIVWDRLRLYWDGFKETYVPYPPLEEQREIVAHIENQAGALTALTTEAETALALLAERRGALIAEAVSGRSRSAPVTA